MKMFVKEIELIIMQSYLENFESWMCFQCLLYQHKVKRAIVYSERYFNKLKNEHLFNTEFTHFQNQNITKYFVGMFVFRNDGSFRYIRHINYNFLLY